MTSLHDITDRLTAIRQQIDDSCQRARRPSGSVTLVAVSKFHPQTAVCEALASGQRVFGENRVQEAKTKFTGLRSDWPDLKLHIIGALQTNKALDACRIADTIESLDRESLADAIARAADRCGRLPQLFVQVNTGAEPQKAGVARAHADHFIDLCKKRFGAAVSGVMCIPPENAEPAKHFDYLASLARTHELPNLSMGMSTDFASAIEHGATHVRVGTAIFGARPAPIETA